jgi:hypothetical protein
MVCAFAAEAEPATVIASKTARIARREPDM